MTTTMIAAVVTAAAAKVGANRTRIV